jgi:hypothetical protein
VKNTFNEMGGACSTHEREEKCVQNLDGKPEGKRPLGRPRYRGGILSEGVDWIHLVQDNNVNKVVKL